MQAELLTEWTKYKINDPSSVSNSGTAGTDGVGQVTSKNAIDCSIAANENVPDLPSLEEKLKDKATEDNIEELIYILSLHHNPWFLDIGAQAGAWSLSMALAGHEVFAIETSADERKTLCQYINQRDLSKKVHVMDLGISGQNQLSDKQSTLDDLMPYLPTDRPVAIRFHTAAKSTLEGGLAFLHKSYIVYASMELNVGELKGNKPLIKSFVDAFDKNGLSPLHRVEGMHDKALVTRNAPQWFKKDGPFRVVFKNFNDSGLNRQVGSG